MALIVGSMKLHPFILLCGPGSKAELTSIMGRNINSSSGWFPVTEIWGLGGLLRVFWSFLLLDLWVCWLVVFLVRKVFIFNISSFDVFLNKFHSKNFLLSNHFALVRVLYMICQNISPKLLQGNLLHVEEGFYGKRGMQAE